MKSTRFLLDGKVKFSIKICLILVSTILYVTSCDNERKVLSNPYKVKYYYGSRFADAQFLVPQFGVQKIFDDSINKIAFLDSNNNIVFGSLNNEIKGVKKLLFNNEVDSLIYYSIRIIRDRLFLLDVENQKFIIYQVMDDSVRVINKINLKNLFDWNQYSMRFQYDNCFEIISSYLFLPYAINRLQTNYLDKYTYLKIRFSENDSIYQVVDTVLFYPNDFKKRGNRGTYSILKKFSDSIYIYGFENYDSLYLYNYKKDTLMSGIKFSNNSKYHKFDNRKKTDLSYIKWFDITNEFNRKIIINHNQTVLVIKRKMKSKISDKDIFEYFFLDKDLKVIANDIFSHTVNPFFCFSYNTGFLVFNHSLDSAYYYE